MSSRLDQSKLMKPEEDRIVIIQRVHLNLVETKRRAKDRTERKTSQTTRWSPEVWIVGCSGLEGKVDKSSTR